MPTYRKLLLAVSVILLGSVGLAPNRAQGDQSLQPKELNAIEETIRRSLWVEAEALFTLETKELATVYANDTRGGDIGESDLALIRYIRQDKSVKLADVGWLDAREAVTLFSPEIAAICGQKTGHR